MQRGTVVGASFLFGLSRDRSELDLLGLRSFRLSALIVCCLTCSLPSLEILVSVENLLDFHGCGDGSWPCRFQGQEAFGW